MTELSFSGHYVCSEGITPLPTAMDAIVNFVKPEKRKALRRSGNGKLLPSFYSSLCGEIDTFEYFVDRSQRGPE